MFSLRYLIVTLALATTHVFAQCMYSSRGDLLMTVVNPISRPTVGDILVAGGTFDILV
jgi:hypothetical protein